MNVYNDTVKRKGKWQIDLLPSASISITADVDHSFNDHSILNVLAV